MCWYAFSENILKYLIVIHVNLFFGEPALLLYFALPTNSQSIYKYSEKCIPLSLCLIVGVTCRDPDNVPNGQRQGNAPFNCNAVVTYSCFPGFTLSGTSTLTCRDNGVWSAPVPECRSKLQTCVTENEKPIHKPKLSQTDNSYFASLSIIDKLFLVAEKNSYSLSLQWSNKYFINVLIKATPLSMDEKLSKILPSLFQDR